MKNSRTTKSLDMREEGNKQPSKPIYTQKDWDIREAMIIASANATAQQELLVWKVDWLDEIRLKIASYSNLSIEQTNSVLKLLKEQHD